LALFALIYRYVDDPAIVSKHRPAHRKYLQDLADEGELIAAGPLGEPGPAGGLLVFRSESVDRVKKIIGGDPFHIQGVLADYFVQEWTLAFGSELFAPSAT